MNGSTWNARVAISRIALAVAIVFGALTGMPGAFAQATWTSATSGTWGDTANWSTGIVPGAGNNTAAVLTNTSASYTVTYDTAMTGTLAGFVLKNKVGGTTTLNINAPGFTIAGSGTTAGAGGEMAYATINVNAGGVFTNNGQLGATGANNSVVVNGGLLNSSNNFGYAPGLLDGVKIGLTLSSGTVNSSGGFFFPALTMTGGAVNVTGNSQPGLNTSTISGGTFTNTSTQPIINRGGITVTGSAYVSTTGLSMVGNVNTIVISGGTVLITGSQFYMGNGSTLTGARVGNISQSAGNVTSSNAAGLVVGNASGALSSAADWAYVLSGGTLSLEKITLAAAGYIGAGTNRFTMSGGTLTLGSGGIVIGSGSGVKAVQLSGGTITAAADWSSSANMTLLTSAGTGTATFQAADAGNVVRNITLSGILSGSGALAKTGGGVLALQNANTYIGNTRVSAGRLLLSGSGSINSSSGITLAGGELKTNSSTAINRTISFGAGGGTISGTGSIASLVTAGTGAVLSPGNSPGTQAYTAGLLWNPGGNYTWETNSLTGTAGTNWDVLNVSGGALDLSGLSSGSQFTLDLTTLAAGDVAGDLGTPYDGGSYTFQIANYTSLLLPFGYGSTAGSDLTSLFSFNSLANWQGAKPAVGDISVKVNSTATGLDLVIVPEPDTIIFAGIGIAMAGWSLWKRGRVARILKRD